MLRIDHIRCRSLAMIGFLKSQIVDTFKMFIHRSSLISSPRSSKEFDSTRNNSSLTIATMMSILRSIVDVRVISVLDRRWLAV
jgi:hypothetical protein